MKFFRKHRFKILISFLVMILLIVSFYMLWVHVPYSNHVNELEAVKNSIVASDNYSKVDYFGRYDGEKSYYIVHGKKDKKEQYAVYDEKQKFIKSYSGDVASEDDCVAAFESKYKCKVSAVSVGYENEIFVYSLMYRGNDSLIYAFYGIDTGEFIKAYRIDNSR